MVSLHSRAMCQLLSVIYCRYFLVNAEQRSGEQRCCTGRVAAAAQPFRQTGECAAFSVGVAQAHFTLCASASS